jgi:hypothetical protein
MMAQLLPRRWVYLLLALYVLDVGLAAAAVLLLAT